MIDRKSYPEHILAVRVHQPGENNKSKRLPGCSRSRKKSFLRMRGTTVPRKEQNKAFNEEIGQPGERLRLLLHKKVYYGDELI